MELLLKDKLIIVTGGAKGIGKGISTVLALEGAIPIIVGRSQRDCEHAVEDIRSKGGRADYVEAELTNPLNCAAVVEIIKDRYSKIDGLVNNAGVNDGVGLINGNYDLFLSSLHKNLIHYYMMAHFVVNELIKSKGSIVNIGSKTAETGQGNTSAYAASNGGRNALTREWAVELLKYGVRVNSVIVAECFTPLYEEWIKTFENPSDKLKSITEKIPLGKRMTTSEEIANMVVFLLSEKSSHTTGQIIHVDGGYTHLDRAL